MGFFANLLGIEAPRNEVPRNEAPRRNVSAGAPQTPDEQALARYRYMLKSAPPETVEQAHAEAFAKLTPEQRQQVLSGLVQAAPENERNAVAATSADDPRALARVATRAEIRQPGVMERTLGGGMGFGGSLLTSLAAGFVGSMVANSFFSAMGGFGDHGAVADNESHGEDANDGQDDQGGADDGGFDDGGFDGGGDFEA